MVASAPQTIEALEDFLTAVIDLAAGRIVALKPQSAMYERLGSAGIALLERVVRYAQSRDILVLLDAKRGDISATAEAYAEAYLMPDSPNPVDAMTVNPYMGIDTIEPYIQLSVKFGKGVFVVLKTSNPGSGRFQSLRTGKTTVYGTIAEALRPLSDALCGDSQWSSLGVVVGVTYPEEAAEIRALLPRALFLFPGYGYQRGALSQIRAALVAGPHGLEGAIISSSRDTLFPVISQTAPFEAWKTSFDDQLGRHIRGVADIL